MKESFAERLMAFIIIFVCAGILPGCNSADRVSPEDNEAEITKAYMEYRQALLNGDIESLKKLISKQKVHEFEGPMAEQKLAMVMSMYPENITVTSVTVNGSDATITVTSPPVDGGTMNGTVSFQKEDGNWKILEENWEVNFTMEFAEEGLQRQDTMQQDIPRPYEYRKIVGIWEGKEAGTSGWNWEFAFESNYKITANGPRGHYYRGESMVDNDLGLEDDSIRVLPGGGPFDVVIKDSSESGIIGKISLGSYKLMSDKLQLCGSRPGMMKRTSTFASAGGIRCFELRRLQELSPSPQHTDETDNSTYHLRTEKRVYMPGERITVYYANLPGNSQDWITLVRTSAPEDSYDEWIYTNGKTDDKHIFNGLQEGEYEIRLYFDWPNGGYQVEDRLQVSVKGSEVQSRTQSPVDAHFDNREIQDIQGKAHIVMDDVSETYMLKTGFFSETRFDNPKRASVQFQVPAPEHSNARRIEIILDATKIGTHYADGSLLNSTFMGDEGVRLKIGESTSAGSTASFRWVADGGQIFFPKPDCTIMITSPYTGTSSSVFSGGVRNCNIHSAGIDYNISSIDFTVEGVPSR